MIAAVVAYALHHGAPAHPTGRDAVAELRQPKLASITGDLEPADVDILICARRGDALPRCATARNAYQLDDLAPGPYAVWASAAGRASDLQRVELAPGDRARVDLAVASAGGSGAAQARVHGVVRDVRGHAIAGAVVHVASAGAGDDAGSAAADATPHDVSATSDDDGVYVVYLPPGDVTARATADGFVDASAAGSAPGELDLTLSPGGSLAGTVVDAATRAPVAGADVEAGGEHATSDAAGRFRLTKLEAGRYKPTATAFGGYGEADESVLVPLGGAVDGVVIAVHPVAVVSGRVALATGAGCPAGDGRVWLQKSGGRAAYSAETLDDGEIVLDGVVPGRYGVAVTCTGWVPLVPYDDIVVADSDVEGVTWLVLAGATVTGHVTSRAGAPIADAQVGAVGPADHMFTMARTDAAGAYTIRGVAVGPFEMVVRADGFVHGGDRPKGFASLDAPARVDIVLDAGATIAGDVVDDAGVAIAGAEVDVDGDGESTSGRCDGRGQFAISDLLGGHYGVHADLAGGSASGTVATDVAAGATAHVHVVATRATGELTGTVRDAAGAPVADAYVAAAPEHGDGDGVSGGVGAWSDAVLTAGDGSWSIAHVSATATFAVRAERRGAGQAVVAHATPGTAVTIVIRATGAISGVVATPAGAPPVDVTVTAELRGDEGTHAEASREERAFHTGGRFAFHDLPAGTYKLAVDDDPRSVVRVTIGDGEARDGVRLVVQPRYAIRGRLVSATTGAPLAGWRVEVPQILGDDGDDGSGGRHVTTYTTAVGMAGADGRFAVLDLPGGTVTVSAGAPDAADASPVRDVTMAGGVDVDMGDVAVGSGSSTAPP
nr:carboxypeptidase regulatory-like domain-containing protein [Kofleriaceae bacterium]